MRKTLLLAVLTLTATTVARAGDDDLFSRDRLNSTYGKPGETKQTAPRPQRREVSTMNSLQSVLLAAGYSARIDENESLRIDLSGSDWTKTVVMTLAENDRELRMAMPLTSAGTPVDAATLRKLLEANRTHWDAFFSVGSGGQMIALVKTVSNNGLDSNRLSGELKGLADMAEKTKDLWNTAGTPTTAKKTETETTPQAAPEQPATTAPAKVTPIVKSTPAATLSLNGKWIATPNNNEAFALQLDAGGSFRLVHVKGTNSTKSQGNFTLAGTTLTLKGDDGTTLAGTVTKQDKQFTLTMNGAGGKSFTLTFKAS